MSEKKSKKKSEEKSDEITINDLTYSLVCQLPDGTSRQVLIDNQSLKCFVELYREIKGKVQVTEEVIEGLTIKS